MKYDETIRPPAPRIEVTISNPQSRDSRPSKGRLDTGADCTFIPDSLAVDLHLNPVRLRDVIDISGSTRRQWSFLVNMAFNGFSFDFIEVLITPLEDVILGRDVLNLLRLILDGKKLSFEIHDP